MAATSELRIDSLLSGFDQICEDFKRRIEEIQFLKSNWNAEIKRREALEFTCDSLKQESLNNLAEQLENRAICQRLKELQRRNDEYQSKEEEHRKAVELLKKDHLKEVGDLEAKVRGLLLEKATNEATTSQLQKDLATQKDQVQVLSKRLDQLHSDKESEYLLEILDLKDCLLVEQEEKNELNKKLKDVEKELLISRMKLVEQQGDSASNRQVETLKLKIMKLRKENEILKRKLSSVQES
ncbi:protein At-4/1 isoform X2 [Durio zibethinus]|uniref:Protein At-4/1 isoform X2 n=1 Tax=Durio zibethinus TaxID=66656 RepID=A0A6P5ZKX3_DURZI|nr:protein At-4/1 isoform X2 [Durio zibethinus]